MHTHRDHKWTRVDCSDGNSDDVYPGYVDAYCYWLIVAYPPLGNEECMPDSRLVILNQDTLDLSDVNRMVKKYDIKCTLPESSSVKRIFSIL